MQKKACDHTGVPIKVIGDWEGAALVGGYHTQFQLLQCSRCNGVFGFPQGNLDLALKDGTTEVKDKLVELMGLKGGKK